MNKMSLPSAAIASLLSLASAYSADLPLNPVLAAVKGNVTVATSGSSATPAAAQQSLIMGSEIETGRQSAAVISLVPGISAKLKEKTIVRLKSAQVGDGERFAEVELVKGRVHSRLTKQGTLTQKYRVDTGAAEWAEAHGTMWTSGNEGLKRHAAVIEGEIKWNSMPYVKDIPVPTGSVLMAKYAPKGGSSQLASVIVVNLVDGTTIVYYPLEGTEPITRPATAEELKDARDLFNDALGDQETLQSDNPKLADIISRVNSVLAGAGLGGLVVPTTGPGSNGAGPPGAATSAITP